MEKLLDAADALLAANPEEPPRPDLNLPEEFLARDKDLMELKEGSKGRGWFALKSIAAGTVLMVDKPLAMVMDWQDSVEDEEQDT